MTHICKHCKETYSGRSGRGLCRPCWDKKWVRCKYPPLSKFGGKKAGAIWSKYKEVP